MEYTEVVLRLEGGRMVGLWQPLFWPGAFAVCQHDAVR